ncbi:hypothetical protein GCM10023107_07420 [Actinoplanes octamycinicus]|uniref:tetratricopeptide repeat protein n=1 Tax=Actinoplanes octamycinicus TaxID=135948 RepID=UPI0031E527CA
MSTVYEKLNGNRELDLPFVEAVVRAHHALAKRPGQPDLGRWRRRHRRAQQEQALEVEPSAWLGPAPDLAPAFQERPASAVLDTLVADHGQVVLTGPSGTGKTQLARSAMARAWRKGLVNLAVWVPGHTHEAIVDGFVDASRALGLPDGHDREATARRFRNWLAGRHGYRWVLAIDDLQDPVHLADLWPPADAGSTIVTTQRRDSSLGAGQRKVVEIGAFEPDEALTFLSDQLGDEPGQLAGAGELAAALENHPYSLARAVTFIADYRTDCSGYLRQFRSRSLTELGAYSGGAFTTARLLIEPADRLAPARVAAPLLRLAAVLDPHGIPVPLFATAPIVRLVEADRGAPTTAADTLDGLSCLRRVSLAEFVDGGQRLRVHALTQRAVREASAERLGDLVRCAADALVEWYRACPAETAALRGNVTALLRVAAVALCGPDRLHSAVFEAGNSLTDDGLYRTARAYWEFLLPLAVEHLGAEHQDTLTIRHNLAWTHGRLGDASGARKELSALLPVRVRVLGADHPNVLATREGIAIWAARDGDHETAAAQLTVLVADYLRTLGPHARDTLNTRVELADQRGEAESAQVAADLLGPLLDELRTALPAAAPEIRHAHRLLVLWLARADRVIEALDRMNNLVTECQEQLGRDHLDTLWNRYLAAELLRGAGRTERADAEVTALTADVQRLLQDGHTELTEISDMLDAWWVSGVG